jgi:hypothetical protein
MGSLEDFRGLLVMVAQLLGTSTNTLITTLKKKYISNILIITLKSTFEFIRVLMSSLEDFQALLGYVAQLQPTIILSTIFFKINRMFNENILKANTENI